MADSKPQIVMRSGPIPGSSYYLDKPEVTMGRDFANDIPVPDSEISRRHARFIVKADGVYIEDLGSTNGTFLNGVRLSSLHRLANGDLITLAESTVMSFEWEAAAEVASHVPTYSAHSPEPEPVRREPVYESVVQPVPQRPLAQEPTPERRAKKPWFMNFLVVILIILIIIGLVLTFMPESWWCFLSFNRLPGCY